MLDIRWIRENEDEVQAAADRKGIAVSVAELLACDDDRRRLLLEAEELRQTRNRLSQEIGRLMGTGRSEEAERLKRLAEAAGGKLLPVEHALAGAERRFKELMMLVPNVVSPDTPPGCSDRDNVEVKRVGAAPSFAFEPKDHVALGELHRLLDLPRGVKTGGTRAYYLTGAGAMLHRAVQQLAVDLLARRGFRLLEVPLMVRAEALLGTGYFPLGEDQTFKVEGGDKWLAGTSEVPLVAYYSSETVDVSQPLRLAAASLCFRSEVGSAGRDVHGLYRVHQFAKVEQVVICKADPELAETLLREITANAEKLLRLLELPYRVVAVCAGDMSQKTYKQLDIETWMPSRQAYGETHSSSNLLDFQARRAGIRYRDEEGRLRHCYTLNNTAVASPRILIPLLENHQLEDGSIRIPEALRPYMNGMERLVP